MWSAKNDESWFANHGGSFKNKEFFHKTPTSWPWSKRGAPSQKKKFKARIKANKKVRKRIAIFQEKNLFFVKHFSDILFFSSVIILGVFAFMKKIITFSILLLSTVAGSLYSADYDKEGDRGRQSSSYPSDGSGSGGRGGASAYPSGSGSGGASLVSIS